MTTFYKWNKTKGAVSNCGERKPIVKSHSRWMGAQSVDI